MRKARGSGKERKKNQISKFHEKFLILKLKAEKPDRISLTQTTHTNLLASHQHEYHHPGKPYTDRPCLLAAFLVAAPPILAPTNFVCLAIRALRALLLTRETCPSRTTDISAPSLGMLGQMGLPRRPKRLERRMRRTRKHRKSNWC